MEQTNTKSDQPKEIPESKESDTNVIVSEDAKNEKNERQNNSKKNQNKASSKSTKSGEGQPARSQPPRKITKILGFISDGKEPKVVVSYNDSPSPELVTTSYAHSHCSKLLVKYYESKIKFLFSNDEKQASTKNSNVQKREVHQPTDAPKQTIEQQNTPKDHVEIPIHQVQPTVANTTQAQPVLQQQNTIFNEEQKQEQKDS